jgi:hypothetical protein
LRFEDFERMVARLVTEVPPEFLEGVTGVEVSRKALPHPTRAEVFTLGECIPIPSEGEAPVHGIQSRTVLYHGSFVALAGLQDDFDWRGEAWETLTHELRHHLEWRARAPDLEQFDVAAEHNFARAEGEPFDPDFYRVAEPVADGVFRLDDDYFLEQLVDTVPPTATFHWHGRAYSATVPEGATMPAFLSVEAVEHPPPGDLVLVLARRRGVFGLLRRRATAPPFQALVEARPVNG